jgi:type I restriction enzyme S subunit
VAAIPNERIALAQRVVTFCPDRSRIQQNFLLWYLLGPTFQSLVNRRATGSTVKGIKQRVLRKLPVAIPERDEQLGIAEALDALARRVDSEQAYLGQLCTVKSALMCVLLTGELRVTLDGDSA